MKPFLAAEQLYDKATLTALRQCLISLRDAALAEGMMDWAVVLSHQIAIDAVIIEELES